MSSELFRKYLDIVNENTVDISQVASQLKFLPTRKQPKQYKFVKDGDAGYYRVAKAEYEQTYNPPGK
jgi:hypothetical protein